MPLLAVAYVKGRPGATTTALGLAAVAPAHLGVVMVECDPAGGDLVHRHRLAGMPGLVDLAATARGSTLVREGVASPVTQTIWLGATAVPVVVAPAGGAQTRAALPELTGAGHSVLAPTDRLVIADCGRLAAGSPAWPLIRLANAVLILARARADELAHLRESLGELLYAGTGQVFVLLAHGGIYSPPDVASVLSRHVAEELARDPQAVTVIGPLPTDRRSAAVLDGELLAGKRWLRLPLMSAYSRLSADLLPPLAAGRGGIRQGNTR